MSVSGSVGAEEGAKTAGEAAAADAGAAGAADVGAGAAAADVGAGAAAADVGAGAAAADVGAGAVSAAASAPEIYGTVGGADLGASASSLGIDAAAGLGGVAAASPEIYGVGDTAASASSLGINSAAPTFGGAGIGSSSGLGTDSANSSLSDLSGAETPVVSDSSTLPASADSAAAPGDTTAATTNAATGVTPATAVTPAADVSNAASQSAAAATTPAASTVPVSNDILDTASAQNGTAYGSGATDAGSNSSITSALKQLGAYGKTALSVGKDVAGIALPVESFLTAKKAQTAATTTGATAQNQLNAIAAPASAVSNQLLTNYQSGTLSTADQQSIAQYGQQQQAQIKQYYANAGLSNSSMEASALAQVGVQQNQMMQQALNNELSGGLSAAGVAQGPQLAGVTAATTADQQSQQAMTNFMQTLAKMYSSSGSSNSSS